MKIYMNNVYVTSSSIAWIELLVHDENTLMNKYITLPYYECEDFCRKAKDKGYYVEPLDNKDDLFTIGTDCRRTYIENESDVSRNCIEEHSIGCVYSLYWDLARCKAIYMDRPDCYENGYVGYCSTFNKIRVSASTMSILMSYYDTEDCNWKSKHLIKQTDDSIEQQEFYCAIPKEYCDNFYKYGLLKMDSITINNKDFLIFKYTRNLSIYRNDYNAQFPEPLIIHEMNLSMRYKAAYDLMKFALTAISEELNVPQEELPKSKDNIRHSSLFNDKIGVFFKNNFSKITRNDIAMIYRSVSELCTALINSGQSFTNSVAQARRVLSKLNLPLQADLGVFYLMEILKESLGKTYEAIDFLVDTSDSLYLHLLEVDMYLFSIRLNTYLNPSVLDYKNGESLFDISSKEGSVRVEVWVDGFN